MNDVFARGRRLVALAPLALACAATGTAVGELHEDSHPPRSVVFDWQADASKPERGTMSGTLPDGTHLTGRYYLVVEDVPEQVYAGAWGGAEPYWPDWPVVTPQSTDPTTWNTFVAAYTGHAIATLTSDDGKVVVRCRFTVAAPSVGLARGGTGECKLSNGAMIEHVVLSKD